MIFVALLFGLSVWAVFHSYLIFPYLLQWMASSKQPNQQVFTKEDELPHVIVMMAVYNEEKVLEKKLRSVLNTEYPQDKVHVYVGSDLSTDNTNAMLAKCDAEYVNLHTRVMEQRTGKIGILNGFYRGLKDSYPEAIIISTDANVMFTPTTIFQLVKNFKDTQVGMVAANIQNIGIQADGISKQEQGYVNRENGIKYNEGLVWGTMMGAFGACYAVRMDCFAEAPSNFRSDDFYITMSILEKGNKAICELEAIAYEDVPNDIQEEFSRKTRISVGNYQNLSVWYHLLWPPYRPLGFSFFSHKLLRWLGPFFIITAYITGAILAVYGNHFYQILFLLQNLLLLMPIADHLLKKVGVHSVLLRYVTYFYYMNLALMLGFFKYIKGGITDAWEPTKRNQ